MIRWPLEYFVGVNAEFSAVSPHMLVSPQKDKDSHPMDSKDIKPSLDTSLTIWYASEIS